MYNPYYGYMPQQRITSQQYTPPTPQYALGLQGKSVDSLEVVRATDIPLDGSVSYFPLIDGSAIVTKQLQQDGTSKIVIYKPSEDVNDVQLPKYATLDEVNDVVKKANEKEIKDIKEELKLIKRQVRDLLDDLKVKED